MPSLAKSVVFLTHSEHGQSNVALAVMYELLLSRRVDNIHVISFEPLRKRVLEIQDLAGRAMEHTNRNTSTSVVFHALPGPSLHEAMSFSQTPPLHRPGFLGAVAQYRRMSSGLRSWDSAQYLAVYNNCKRLLEHLDCSTVVVGHLFSPGVDACNVLGIKYSCLSSEMLREHRLPSTSLWYLLCRSPAMCSGYPTPLPWYLTIPNAFLYLILAYYVFVRSAFFRRLMAARKQVGIPGPYPMFVPCNTAVTYFLPTVPECDFPQGGQPPGNIICCGPILLPSIEPKAEVGLSSWVSTGPTMIISFGSALNPNEAYNLKVATALLKVFQRVPELQVLWKLDTSSSSAQASCKILNPFIKAGRVKLEKWIPQIALLQTGYVTCLIHHGGTNSFLEALSCAVPQVILPCWFLTYERANLAEHLGVGIYASKSSQTAPDCNSDELASSVLEVLRNADFKTSACHMAALVNARSGRRTAARHILDMALGGNKM